MAAPLRTNRDLYAFVDELARRHAATGRDLQHYLTALWHLGARHRSESALSLTCFAALLDEAFSAPLPMDAPRSGLEEAGVNEGYQDWERSIASQIADLREMQEAGTLANEYRYCGVSAPSGAPWYNFDPVTFLECGTAGTFGGWQPGDDTGRTHVPGKAAVLDSEGKLTVVDPQDIDDPVYEMADVSWSRFAEFLRAGQAYE